MDSEFNSCLYFATNNLSRTLAALAEQAFREVGMAPSYAFLLLAVNRQPGIQPSELSRILGLTPSTVTRLVEKMEYRGLLSRSSEGRATHIKPTEKCRDMDPEIRKAWQQLRDSYTDVLGERYTEVLTEMSSKAMQQLEDSSS